MSAGRAACTCAQVERVGESDAGADTCAIVAAGGVGERFGDARGKQFVELCGLPIASWSVLAFDRSPSVGRIVVVCAREREAEMRERVLAPLRLQTPVAFAEAGTMRQESVWHGLEAAGEEFELVAVHDAARPLIEVEQIELALAVLRDDAGLAGAICAARVTDTLKLVEAGEIVSTVDRSFYWAAQTPQCFRREALVEAHRAARRVGFEGTDDAALVERLGGRVRCVETSRDNIKVTLPEDLALAEGTLRRRLGIE